MKNIISFCFVFIIFIICKLTAQTNQFNLDLGNKESESNKEIQVNPNSNFKITLINLVPTKKYIYRCIVTHDSIPPLNFKKSTKIIDTSRLIEHCNSIYNELIDSINKFNGIESEKEIKSNKNHFKNYLLSIRNSNCEFDTNIIKELENAELILQRTKMDIKKNFKLKPGEKLEITIIRTDNDAEWTYTFNAGKRGTWLTSFGFSFISNILKQQEEFIVKRISSDSEIVSTFRPARSEFNFAPSIFYSWMPYAKENDTWVYGISGGIGVNLESPVVMFGFSLTYNWNLNLMLGVAGHIINKPSESYSEFQKIDASDVEALNRKSVVFDPFIGFSFRFDSNPFSK